MNENTDNIVIDVNGKRNVAGAGISDAQRIMDQGDGGNLLFGPAVFERLRQREKYHSRTKRFTATIKHGFTLEVHQLTDAKIHYLNNDTPSNFVSDEHKRPTPTLSLTTAYIIGYLIKHSSDIKRLAGGGNRNESLFLVMVGLARTRVLQLEAKGFAPADPVHSPLPKLSDMQAIGLSVSDDKDIDSLFNYYHRLEFHICYEHAIDLRQKYIIKPGLHGFFKSEYDYVVPSESGERAVREGWPQVVEDLGI